jgi:hypothetical protein
MKSLIPIFLISKNIFASSLFMPDTDTALLMSLVSNTASQLTRLEQLINETDKHTKLFRESVEIIEEKYEVVDQLETMASNYAQLAKERPENLSEINDVIENLKDQKEKLRELIKKSKIAERESASVKSETKTIDGKLNSDNQVAKKQIAKSFGASKTTSKNMDRINAQNTSLILKETISLNGAINTNNGLQATQNNLTKIQVDQIIADGISKENALTNTKKRKLR